jgi:hypothetical protein
MKHFYYTFVQIIPSWAPFILFVATDVNLFIKGRISLTDNVM